MVDWQNGNGGGGRDCEEWKKIIAITKSKLTWWTKKTLNRNQNNKAQVEKKICK